MPQYTNKKKTCEGDQKGGVCRPPNRVHRMCSLPWENRFGNLDVQHAEMRVENTVFGHFAASDCGRRSMAVANNPSQPDFAPDTFFSAMTWYNVDDNARMQLGDTSYQTHEAAACGKSCDAVNNLKITDVDGSTALDFWNRDCDDSSAVNGSTACRRLDAYDAKNFVLMSSTNPQVTRYDKCVADPNTKSNICHDYKLKRLVLESKPPRFTKRRLGPATVTKYGEEGAHPLKSSETDTRVGFSVGPFPQGCSCQKHFAQFTFEVETGIEYRLDTTGSLMDKNRISFHSSDPTECILASVFFAQPMNVEVINQAGAIVPQKVNGQVPTVQDASGTNAMVTQERLLYVTLCGGPSPAVFWLNYGSLVQVTAQIQMTTDEFFQVGETDNIKATEVFINNVAMLLGIDTSTVRVACVKKPGCGCIKQDTYKNDPCYSGGRVRRAGQEAPDELGNLTIVNLEIAAHRATDLAGANETGSNETNSEVMLKIGEDLMNAIDNGNMTKVLVEAGFKDMVWEDFNFDDNIFTTTTSTSSSTRASTAASSTTAEAESSEGSDDDRTVMIVVIAVVVALLVICAGILLIVFCRSNDRNGTKSSSNPQYDSGGGGMHVTETEFFNQPQSRRNSFEELGNFAITPVRGSVHGGAPAAAAEPSYFASRSRAEAQKDSLFAPSDRVTTNSDQAYFDVCPERPSAADTKF